MNYIEKSVHFRVNIRKQLHQLHNFTLSSSYGSTRPIFVCSFNFTKLHKNYTFPFFDNVLLLVY